MALVDVIIGYAKGAQGDVGPQGPTGPQGPEGPQGPLPSLVNNALSTTPGVAALDAAMGKTLQDQITTANSNLTPVYTTVTNADGSVLFMESTNKNRILHYSYNNDLAAISMGAWESITLGVLPAGNKPKNSIDRPVMAKNNGNTIFNCVVLHVNTDGQVALSNFSPNAIALHTVLGGAEFTAYS